MSTLAGPFVRPSIIYPDTDGLPMAESETLARKERERADRLQAELEQLRRKARD